MKHSEHGRVGLPGVKGLQHRGGPVWLAGGGDADEALALGKVFFETEAIREHVWRDDELLLLVSLAARLA